MQRIVVTGLFLIVAGTSCWAASEDPYKISAKEKSACTTDAIRLCSYTYPSEPALLQCMKTNRSSLSATCQVAFDAGVKRRHL